MLTSLVLTTLLLPYRTPMPMPRQEPPLGIAKASTITNAIPQASSVRIPLQMILRLNSSKVKVGGPLSLTLTIRNFTKTPVSIKRVSGETLTLAVFVRNLKTMKTVATPFGKSIAAPPLSLTAGKTMSLLKGAIKNRLAPGRYEVVASYSYQAAKGSRISPEKATLYGTWECSVPFEVRK